MFQAHPSVLALEEAGTASKDLNHVSASVTGESHSSVVDGSLELEHQTPDLAEMRSYLSSGVGQLGGDPARRERPCDLAGAASERFEEFVEAGMPHLASEIWRYCAFHIEGGAYVNAESPLLMTIGRASIKLAQT